ncbi:MAG: hypothetical protein CBB95_09845 [Alteromonas sp. TMED35]|uniref:DNA replication terminus site-binding protein n=1 Tax=uncultured Alteromonas sp. TaxID=179113 RepID=UPI000B6C681A|nr:MAG: hypothetical protein CBB95_09845 [Alteromonas sp. TMED35]
MEPNVELTESLFRESRTIREDYFALLSHIDSLNLVLRGQQMLHATVYMLDVGKVQDVGIQHINLAPDVVTGRQAFERGLLHYSDHHLVDEQAGVMAKRLPGVIQLRVDDQQEICDRVNIINQRKDSLMQLVRDVSPDKDVQFEVMKQAIPMGIRKAIGRHIHVIPKDELKRLSFSFSNRVSMSKKASRDEWLKKLDNSEKYARSQLDSTAWSEQIDIERKALSTLPPSALLRQERPIRKTPIANVYFHRRRKTTFVAHSPILVLDDNVELGGFRMYQGDSSGKRSAKKEPVVPRLHLYWVNQ